jgi:hypothetical protein
MVQAHELQRDVAARVLTVVDAVLRRAQDCEQEVFGADIVIAGDLGLTPRLLDDLLGDR